MRTQRGNQQKLWAFIAAAMLGLFLTVPAEATTTVPVTSGLQLWLRADMGVTTNINGNVTAWADQSGNGYDATTSGSYLPSLIAPSSEFGDLPAIFFDGVHDYMTGTGLGFNTAGEMTIFIKLKMPTQVTNAGIFTILPVTGYDWNTADGMTISQRSNTGVAVSQGYEYHSTPGSDDVNLAANAPLNAVTVLAYQKAGTNDGSTSTGTASMWVDGTFAGSDTYSLNTTTSAAGYFISARANPAPTASLYGNNAISEIIVFDRALTSSEMDQMSQYLIPEPATMAMLGLGGVMMLIRRRRK